MFDFPTVQKCPPLVEMSKEQVFLEHQEIQEILQEGSVKKVHLSHETASALDIFSNKERNRTSSCDKFKEIQESGLQKKGKDEVDSEFPI